MNSNNFDIDRMRKTWIGMGKALEMETPSSEPYNLNNMNTDLDELRMRYMKGCKSSVFCGIIFTVFIYFMPPLNDEYRLPVALSYAILLFANAYVLYWFRQGVSKIDPITMSISQVSSLAKYYKKCHLRYHILGTLATIPWIAYFIYTLIRSEFRAMEGIFIGIIIGGIGGLRGLWEYLSDYRNLSR